MKKIVLILMVAVCFRFVSNAVLADEYDAERNYVSEVQKKVDGNWLQPLDTKGKSSVISFKINNQGLVYDMKMLRSSGDLAFDKSAVSAINKAAPFKDYPNTSNPASIQVFFSPIFTSAILSHDENLSNMIDVANLEPNLAFCDYLANLQNQINSNWHPKSTSKKKKAVACVVIDQDGTLKDYYILKSSKDRKFDRGVTDAISSSVPYDAFPRNIIEAKKEIQLAFTYNKTNPTAFEDYNHFVTSSITNIYGYDAYTKQVHQVIEDSFAGKRCFFNKDLIVELKISKVGKLKYVKIVKSSGDYNFDNKVLRVLQKTAYPPVPETISSGDVTLKYEILTLIGPKFKDYFVNYVLCFFTKEVRAYNVIME